MPDGTPHPDAIERLSSAYRWLYRADNDDAGSASSMMAFHALGEASKDLECAATLLPLALAEQAIALAARCDAAANTAGFPLYGDITTDIDALRTAALGYEERAVA